VPINLVRKVVRDLRDYGVVQRGILGVFIDEMTNELAKKLGLENVEGVYINRVTPGSGADDAGLEKGDVIIGINGVKTKTLPEMQEQLGRYRPGNAIQVEIIRNKARTVKEVVLKNKSNSTALVTSQNADILLELGFEVRELSRQESRRLKAEGVKVISIYRGSRIERTNMDPGFVITKVDNRAVNSVDELVALLEQSSGKVMLEGIYEGYAGEYYYAFPVD
jgi:S1-C subfamily serine protease